MNFKIVDQRFDGFEAWIRVGEVNLRLDFILEFYLSGDLLISRENHCNYRDKECIEKFATSFLHKYESLIRNSFRNEDYELWIQENAEWILQTSTELAKSDNS